jgi:uncharacterized protein (TIGR03435 family)
MRRFALLLALGSSIVAQSAKKLEFEVASIKPTPPPDASGALPPTGCRGGPSTDDPELLVCGNMSLFSLTLLAHQIDRVQYYRLITPDWTRELPGFDLRARVKEGATKDDLSVMLRNLLAERFKLTVHHESREMQEYDLLVAKKGPKFKEAAPPKPKPDGGTPTPAPVKLGADGYPALPTGHTAAIIDGRARVYQPATTMAMFASLIATQLGKPVRDATGLSGKYEISLYWDTAIRSVPPAAGDQAPVASDPGPTLMQAVQDQLGLRLESKKGIVDFVVVDHAEKVPTENFF